MTALHCRFCGQVLDAVFADLGLTPLANSYVRKEDLAEPETFYPLTARVCDRCLLVQVPEFETPDRIFSDYAYFSSYSTTWLAHAERFAHSVSNRLGLGANSLVMEIASNDWYLLREFSRRGIPVQGIEPARNVAEVALERGIPTTIAFFGSSLAEAVAAERRPDLVVCNNVLAHVPDLNDFVRGLRIVSHPGTVVTIEVPHLLRLIEDRQFDTIYHEHFSYFSLTTLVEVFAAHDMTIFDVEELPTHGGSLRAYARCAGAGVDLGEPVIDLLRRENEFGIRDISTYRRFGALVADEKRAILSFLLECLDRGWTIAGYGAPAKGNTMLNFCGVGCDMIGFTVDRNPEKQGRYLPGSRIPILEPAALLERRPDVVVILPWNLRDEIAAQLHFVGEWGGRLASRTPEMRLLS